MKKAAIITFLSPIREGKEEQYTVSGSDQTITGAETNDAPVKYLLHKASENGNPVRRIICIVSEKVYERGNPDSSYNRFQKMVKDYVSNQPDLAKTSNQLHFDMIPYDFYFSEDNTVNTIDIQQNKALSVYQNMTRALEGCSEIYIDYTGGFRDTSFLTTVLIRYLEFINITCRDIIYSNYDDKKIYSISYIYDMFQLLNAVSQFVETGSGKLLHNIYDSVRHEPTKHLVKCIQKFSHEIQLCDIKEIDKVIEALTEAICKLEENTIQPAKPDIQVQIFRELLQVIKAKFYLEGENTSFTYPKLIKWCVDNGLLQQALTLYTEKMPIEYIRKGIVKQLPCSENDNKAKFSEVDNFYTAICMDILKKTEGKDIQKKEDEISVLKNLILEIQEKHKTNPDYRKNINETIKNCTNKKLAEALIRIRKFLDTHYCNYNYKTKNECNQNWSYCNIQITAVQGKSFLNGLTNDSSLIYAFICNDPQKVKEYKYKMKNKDNMTYQKKVTALKKLSELKDISDYSDSLSNEALKILLTYYTAIKYLRNHANHASEKNRSNSDKILIQYLKEHDIQTDLTVENVQKMILDGLHLTNPELF